MSKNIIIQEGGVGKQLTADKLRANLVGGGTQDYIMADAVSLTDKTITEDGTYTAKNEGYYGYRSVTIRGIGVAEGTDPDGDDAQTKPDPDTGELITDKIPSSIVIAVPPTKLDYVDGETINFAGMIVQAHLKTGGIFNGENYPNGVIPFAELILPVTVADYSAATEAIAQSDLIPDAFEYSKGSGTILYHWTWEGNIRSGTGILTCDSEDACIAIVKGESAVWFVGASKNPGDTMNLHTKVVYEESGQIIEGDAYFNLDQAYTHDGRTAYFGGSSAYSLAANIDSVSPDSNIDTTAYHADVVSWTMLYGDNTDGGQTIPVQWTSPYNSKTFEDSFDITVAQNTGYGGATGGGGSTEGGGGAGRND